MLHKTTQPSLGGTRKNSNVYTIRNTLKLCTTTYKNRSKSDQINHIEIQGGELQILKHNRSRLEIINQITLILSRKLKVQSYR